MYIYIYIKRHTVYKFIVIFVVNRQYIICVYSIIV